MFYRKTPTPQVDEVYGVEVVDGNLLLLLLLLLLVVVVVVVVAAAAAAVSVF